MAINFRQFEERLSGGLRNMGTCDSIPAPLTFLFLSYLCSDSSFIEVRKQMGNCIQGSFPSTRASDSTPRQFDFTTKQIPQLTQKQKTNTKRTYYHSCSRTSSWKKRPVARYTQHSQVHDSWEQRELKLNLVRN